MLKKKQRKLLHVGHWNRLDPDRKPLQSYIEVPVPRKAPGAVISEQNGMRLVAKA